MSIFRIDKTHDYTVMSNIHLRDERLSLSAKGIMSVMLSLPDDWDFSMSGLIAICKESRTAVDRAVKELKEAGYVSVTPERDETGRFHYVFNVFECPQEKVEEETEPVDNSTEIEEKITDARFPTTVNPTTVNPSTENVQQLNTNNQILTSKYITTMTTQRRRTRARSERNETIVACGQVPTTQHEATKAKALANKLIRRSWGRSATSYDAEKVMSCAHRVVSFKDTLIGVLDEARMELLAEAFSKSAIYGVPNWAYIDKMLLDWQTKGIETLTDLQDFEDERRRMGVG